MESQHYLGALEQLAPLVAQHRATFDQDRRLPHVVCIDIVWSERGAPLVQAPAGEGGFGSKMEHIILSPTDYRPRPPNVATQLAISFTKSTCLVAPVFWKIRSR